MFGNQSLDLVRQLFADQFQPDGSNYIYRKRRTGAPIPVSASEREKYIAAFNTFIKYLLWTMFAGFTGLIMFFAIYSASTGTEISQMDFYLGIGVIVVLFLGLHFWGYNAPMRDLRGRGAIGEPLSRAEVRRLSFAKITYAQLALSIPVAAFLLFKIDSKQDLLAGWNLCWLVLGTASLIVSAVQAFRKWRFESGQM